MVSDFWQRLKQRKLVQWAVAYGAFAFACPGGVQRGLALAPVLGLLVVLLLTDPFILRYRDDPRFATFRRKIGLPDSTTANAMP